ncbi:MAG TPA: hypothetical protein VM659_12705, partial [Dongiaceae bacterium]|nr:hypothetical protein [Dongiaceae bacterium]
ESHICAKNRTAYIVWLTPRDLLIADNHGHKEKSLTITALIGAGHEQRGAGGLAQDDKLHNHRGEERRCAEAG